MTRARRRGRLSLVLLVLAPATAAGCAASPRWQSELLPALSAARRDGAPMVVFFAAPGRQQSDRMQTELHDPEVLDALADGGFTAVVADATVHDRLHADWVAGRDGFGIAVLGADGQPFAARPGPQDPDELAAFVRRCTAQRGELAALRQRATGPDAGPTDALAFGALLLELGCRREAELQLVTAATGGVADARHRLARLYALDGDLVRARRWLAAAPPTPAAMVSEGYLRFKERDFAAAVKSFEAALADGGRTLGDDRQRALLYLGKSLHEARDDARAVPVLEALLAEGTGSVFEAGAAHTLRHIREPQHAAAH